MTLLQTMAPPHRRWRPVARMRKTRLPPSWSTKEQTRQIASSGSLRRIQISSRDGDIGRDSSLKVSRDRIKELPGKLGSDCLLLMFEVDERIRPAFRLLRNEIAPFPYGRR